MNLVLQGPGASASAVEELARMTKPSAIDASSKVFTLRNANRADIDSYCAQRQIDYAWMPEGRRFAELELLAMDMDSTLITIECIDELGDFAGKKAEVAAITAQAMRGELDYPASLKKRVSVLQGLSDSVLDRVYDERLRLTPGAEALIAECKKHDVKLLLVSGGFTFFTERLKQRLGIDYTISNTLEIKGGKLSGQVLGDIVDAGAKAAKFKQVLAELKASKEQSVAIGDGANDLKMMAEAGVSVAFRAKPVVRAQATCALNYSGLDGVVNLFE